MTTTVFFRYCHMLKHWAGMLSGHSYWHQDQAIGRQFRSGELHGYFNDLTAKAVWSGETDTSGVPLCRCSGRTVYWPVTIAQKGLAHWDLWLESGHTAQEHRKAFFDAAGWLAKSQDARGGWTYPVLVDSTSLSSYSCMSQGEGASVLVRAFKETGIEDYVRAAKRALEIMLAPIDSGGTAVQLGDQLILDEYPSSRCTPVMNGWIFAIFGLYDYGLAVPDQTISVALAKTVLTLAEWLPKFDAGYWSRYDTAGAIASPFYHRLHIAQLDALSRAFPEQVEFAAWRNRFESQLRSTLKASRAVGCKLIQKLMHPPRIVIEA